jgi:hypothetical protein
MTPRPNAPRSAFAPLAYAAALLLSLAAGCGASAPLRADLAPMAIAEAAAPPAPIDHDAFHRDQTGALSEDDLRALISGPVFLAEATRIGVVPVASSYGADEAIPLVGVPAVLAEALDDTGFFEMASEVSTDWPADGGISGLRELAARYQTRYLLLFRHRFVERTHPNGWAATYVALVTIPFVPGRVLETAGVLEATLFDVRTGTLLFTVHERVYAASDENVWANERKLRELREELLEEGAERLAEAVTHQMHRLVASRPTPGGAPSATASRDTATPGTPR